MRLWNYLSRMRPSERRVSGEGPPEHPAGAEVLSGDELQPEFASLLFGSHALQKLLQEYRFESVLDIGTGAGQHAEIFIRHGKKVTAVDRGNSCYFRQNRSALDVRRGDFNEMEFDGPFDCVWCCHVLEHQLNVNRFLRKVHSVLRDGGVLALTVPPPKNRIVGGHVSLWNAGLLLYNLVLAGFACRGARILQYGYNISVILTKIPAGLPRDLSFDRGDLRRLRPFLPAGLSFVPDEVDDPFEGDIRRLNW